ncbi:MAG: hypothetical protein LUQ16_00835 [Methanomassiliicoccales archaeon]|nr:hypothetical protein [Methanomassiliicoccales archaeon]
MPLTLPSVEAAAVPVIDLELNGGYDTPFAVENLKPGDMGSKSVVLRNIGNVDGEIAIWISNILESDFAGDGAHLDDYLLFDVSCTDISTDVRTPCPIRSLPSAPVGSSYIWVLNVRAGQTIQINWLWEFVENYQSQNEAQGDSLSFDINYLLGDMLPPSQGMSWLKVDVLGRITTALLDNEGRATSQVVAFDEARSVSLTIPEGARCVSEDNGTISSIVISKDEGALPVEAGQALIGPVYSIDAFVSSEEQAQVFLDIPATLRINYDPALLPSITETIGLYMHLEGSSWVPLTMAVDSPSYIGQCASIINRSGQVGVIASFDPLESAYFLPSSLTIDPSRQVWWDPIIFASRVGKVIKVTVMLTNIGQVGGVENVTLLVNGNEVEVEQVALGPLETREVTFDLSGMDEGDYEIEVSGLSGHVAVGTDVNWWLIIAFFCLALGAVVGFAYSASRWDAMRRRVDRLQSSVNDVESKLMVPETSPMPLNQTPIMKSMQVNPGQRTMAKAASSPQPAQSIDETMAAYVASSEPDASQKEERLWIADSFNQVDKALEPEPSISPDAPQIEDEVISGQDSPSSEEGLAFEASIQFMDDVEARRMVLAKGFLLEKIHSEGELVVDEVPEGPSGMIAIAALSQLVEEGKLRVVQEKHRTIYFMNEQ